MTVNAGYVNNKETIDHLTSGCPILAKNEYVMRHDKVCAHLRYLMCRALGIKMTNGMHIHPNQFVNKKMLQCYGIKGYTQ